MVDRSTPPGSLNAALPWVFADLTDEELRAFFEEECSCRTPEQTGTRNGYTCPPHRAQRELDRRHPNRADQW